MPGADLARPLRALRQAALRLRAARPSSLATALLVVPLASTCVLVHQAQRLSADGADAAWPFFALAAANAAISLFSIVALAYVQEKREQADASSRRIREREKEQLGTILRLEDELHLLGAMREFGQILSDDVRFECIWEKVLEILQSLIHPKELTVFIREGDEDGPLVPKVHHRARRSLFGREIEPEKVDASGIPEALEYKSVFLVVEDDELLLFFPLAVDGQNVGVLKVIVPLKGDPGQRLGRIDECQSVLTDLLRHLSLAIKTPTLYEVATLDQLTGLFTKRFFVQQIIQHMKVSRRHGTPFSLILVDIDRFKSVNDTYGHLTGDIVLRGVAQCLIETARETDTCYRYGGEEMCVLLPETSLPEASTLAERIRVQIEGSTFRGAQGETIRATASFGIAAFEKELTEFTDLIERADQALYRAKEGGRNQVWRWEDKGPIPDASGIRPAAKPSRRPARRAVKEAEPV